MLRIIPRLDIKNSNLVKGIHLEGLKILGPPSYFSKYYYENGADELLYIDSVASLYGRNSIFELIESTAENVFIPLTVGGGLRNLDDISKALSCGADKVAINTAFIDNPDFISESSEKYGSSTIVVEIQTKKLFNGKYVSFCENGRRNTGLDPLEWAIFAANSGAGEILITSIDKDGTGLGFDKEITEKISKKVSIPTIASGGAGNSNQIIELLEQTGVDAVGLSSILHYSLTKKLIEEGLEFIENKEFNIVGEKYQTSKLEPLTINALKKQIFNKGFDCRMDYQKI